MEQRRQPHERVERAGTLHVFTRRLHGTQCLRGPRLVHTERCAVQALQPTLQRQAGDTVAVPVVGPPRAQPATAGTGIENALV